MRKDKKMNYILKYDANTYELLEVDKKDENCKLGYIKEKKAIYIPCKSKEDAIKTYKSILREKINLIKQEKRKLNKQMTYIEQLLIER